MIASGHQLYPLAHSHFILNGNAGHEVALFINSDCVSITVSWLHIMTHFTLWCKFLNRITGTAPRITELGIPDANDAAPGCSSQTHAIREPFLAISDRVWKCFQALDLKGSGCWWWWVLSWIPAGGINWPGCDSRGKSSACAGQLASDYSLFCKTEMDFCDILALIWGWTAEKGSTYGWTDPSTLPGSDSNPLYRLKVMSGTLCACVSESWPTGMCHIVFTDNHLLLFSWL